MRYIWALLVSVLLLTSCDDGDIIIDSFNFDTAQVQKCTTSNTLYKISDNEALVFVTPESSFPNETQTETISIGGGNSITYRKYAAAVATSSICETPMQTVTEEWNCIGGDIEIKSTPIYDSATPNKIIAYNHAITFKNLIFQAPGKQIVYDTYAFGNYRTDVLDLAFNFTSPDEVLTCSNNNLIFKYNSNKVLLFDIDKTNLFQNAVTIPGNPRTALINSIDNKVIYRVYSGGLNQNFFCSSITPSTPSLSEEWVADNGVADTSGIIKVVTEATTDPNTFKHTIYLYKTTFRKGIYYYSPNPEGDYKFGTYFTTL